MIAFSYYVHAEMATEGSTPRMKELAQNGEPKVNPLSYNRAKVIIRREIKDPRPNIQVCRILTKIFPGSYDLDPARTYSIPA